MRAGKDFLGDVMESNYAVKEKQVMRLSPPWEQTRNFQGLSGQA
jgi:hypothetical protein